jgi:hypothetical protein
VIGLLVDQNFNEHIVHGMTRRNATIEFTSVRDVGLAEAPDLVVLEWASAHGLVLLKHDRKRSHLVERLRQHQFDPGFRQGEGLLLGEVEDILALSDPPCITACPKPFFKDVIAHHGRHYDPEEPYHSEPCGLDVAEGENNTDYPAIRMERGRTPNATTVETGDEHA